MLKTPTPTSKLTDTQLTVAIAALESAACKDAHELVELAEGTPGDDAKEWAQAFSRTAINFEKHGPGSAIGVALLPRYRELLAEQEARQMIREGKDYKGPAVPAAGTPEEAK